MTEQPLASSSTTTRGTYEDNDIFGNPFAGIEVKGKSAPIVWRNRIHDGKQAGIYLHEDAGGTYEDNQITGNGGAGVYLKERAVPTVRRNKFNDNGYAGVWIADQAGGTFEDNDLRNNKRGPWDIAASAEKSVKRARNIEK